MSAPSTSTSTSTSTPRGTAAAPLLYWLLVVSGLAMLTWLRPDEPDKMAPLWVSTVVATALGHLLARARLRLWLVLFIIVNGMWFCPLVMLHFLQQMSNPWPVMEIFFLAFAPGAICAYLSMSERGGLLAFWFPASLWMLSILDRSDETALSGPLSWVLLSALAALLLGFLRLQETRRLAVWKAHATVRLAEPATPVILRREPLRLAAQLAWIVALAAITLGLTAWIAPHLWQNESIDGQSAAQSVNGGGERDGSGEPCCTEESFDEAPKSRVKEYFSLLRPHESAPSFQPSACVACRDGVPIEAPRAVAAEPATGSGSVASSGGGSAAPGVAPLAATVPPQASAPVPPAPAAAPIAKPIVKPIAAPPSPKRPAIALHPGSVAFGPRSGHGAVLVVAEADAPSAIDPLAWLFTLVITGAAVQLALRPVRRGLALRHLRRPLWPETVDQRVSNLWQLVLVGLRDAGFHAAPGEQPQELARRIALEGMDVCATVLERARHGVRVDAADLDSMERAARAVYVAARLRAGIPARAASWLRWPLI